MVPADLIEGGMELKKTLRIVLIKVKIKKWTANSIFYDCSFEVSEWENVRENALCRIQLITPVFKV